MKIKVYVIDMEIPPRAKRWALRVGIPAGLIAGAGAIAFAAVPKTWNSGDVLTAADLNGNFTNLDSRLTTLQSQLASQAVVSLTVASGSGNASACTASPCVITSQSGQVQQVTHGGTGQYTVAFVPGTFSAAPSCVVTGINAAQACGANNGPNAGVATSASTPVVCWNGNFAGVDSPFSLICVGPR